MTVSEALFEKNISALEKKDREAARLVRNAAGQTDMSCYGSPVLSRTGLCQPRLADGKTLHSDYNPQREADTVAARIGAGFVLFAGLGAGWHIKAYRKRFPRADILVLEKNPASLAVLFSQADFTELTGAPGLSFCFPENLREKLERAYVPAVCGNFTLFPLRAWADCNAGTFAAVKRTAEQALKAIRADYSVQSHFGRIWFRNIFRNLEEAGKDENRRTISFPAGKTAAVVAAGPSLDGTAAMIAAQRPDLYVIATDTALPVLLSRGIEPDAFVSIDGQNISYRHFTCLFPGTGTAVLDLCAHPYAASRARSAGIPVIFTYGGHPLCTYAAGFGNRTTGGICFLPADTGAGTVTATAVDFARRAGFPDAVLYGADFAYTGGKPYCKGTYLDGAYSAAQDRLAPAETCYTGLMFRTPVECGERNCTVRTYAVLKTYARGLEAYAEKNAFTIRRVSPAGLPLSLPVRGKSAYRWEPASYSMQPFPFDSFVRQYAQDLAETTEKYDLPVFSAEITENGTVRTLLPLAAWAAKKGLYKPGIDPFNIIIKLALHEMASYTMGYHE